MFCLECGKTFFFSNEKERKKRRCTQFNSLFLQNMQILSINPPAGGSSSGVHTVSLQQLLVSGAFTRLKQLHVSCGSSVLALTPLFVSPVPMTVHILLFSLEKHRGGGGASSALDLVSVGGWVGTLRNHLRHFYSPARGKVLKMSQFHTHLENGTESEIRLSLSARFIPSHQPSTGITAACLLKKASPLHHFHSRCHLTGVCLLIQGNLKCKSKPAQWLKSHYCPYQSTLSLFSDCVDSVSANSQNTPQSPSLLLVWASSLCDATTCHIWPCQWRTVGHA